MTRFKSCLWTYFIGSDSSVMKILDFEWSSQITWPNSLAVSQLKKASPQTRFESCHFSSCATGGVWHGKIILDTYLALIFFESTHIQFLCLQPSEMAMLEACIILHYFWNCQQMALFVNVLCLFPNSRFYVVKGQTKRLLECF